MHNTKNKLKNQDYIVASFYKFVNVPDPETEVANQYNFCNDIKLRGRIYIGSEGINGTVSGLKGQIQAYKLYLDNHELFNNIEDFDSKLFNADSHQFEKLIVRKRNEIVALGEKYDASEIHAKRNSIPPEEFKKIMEANDDSYVIIDMRNDYEYHLGHFKRALPAGTDHFRDLKSQLESYRKKFEDKKIIIYCTGGIRCEKAAVTLHNAGLKDVYQLQGGIVNYINKFDDGAWLGSLYVFDSRVKTSASESNHSVIGKCHYTGEPADEIFNCRYGFCNRQIIANYKNYKSHFGFCSEECKDIALESLYIRKADFDRIDYKKERLEMRDHPEKSEIMKRRLRERIQKKLEGVIFNHKKAAGFKK